VTIAIGQTVSAHAAAAVTSKTTGSVTTNASGSGFVIVMHSGSSTPSVSDSFGNTYVQIGSTQQYNFSNRWGAIFYCAKGTGGAGHTATGSSGGGAVDISVYLIEITTTNGFGVTLDQASQIASSTLHTTAISTTNANEAIIAAFCGASTNAAATHTVSGGSFAIGGNLDLTNGASSFDSTGCVATEVVSSTQSSLTATFTEVGNSGGSMAMFAASFFEASAISDGEVWAPKLEPGMRIGSPVSKLRGVYGDTTFIPPSSAGDDGGQAPASPRLLRLGTPWSRLRSRGLFADTTRIPPFTVGDGGQSSPAPRRLRLGTPLSRLRSTYDDTSPVGSTAQITAAGVSASANNAADLEPTIGITAAGNAASAGSMDASGVSIAAITAAGVAASAGAGLETGAGALQGAGNGSASGAANLGGSGALSAAGNSSAAGATAVTARFSGAGAGHSAGAANLIGSTAIAFAGSAAAAGAASLAGTGALVAAGTGHASGSANVQPVLFAGGSAAASGVATATGKAPLAASGVAGTAGAIAASAGVQLTAAGVASSSGAMAASGFAAAAPGRSASAGGFALIGEIRTIQIPSGISPHLAAVFAAVRGFVQGVLSTTTPVILGIENRVAEPVEPCVVMTPIGVHRQATNVDTDTDGWPWYSGTTQSLQSTRLDIRLDCYGPESHDWAAMLSTLWRDQYGVDALAPIAAPEYADEARQAPFIGGEDQYLERWWLVAALQYNPVVTTGMTFATTIAVDPINVDVEFPP